jgi:hypothetical protein
LSGVDSGSRSYGNGTNRDPGWPETPDALVYRLDLVLELFNHIQSGQQIDLLESLLECVDWREMFGSEESGFLRRDQVDELKRYYRAKFADVDRYYLAEQLSTELMTALMVSGDEAFSPALKQFGQQHPALWQEIRTFFSRKEVATVSMMLADRPNAD